MRVGGKNFESLSTNKQLLAKGTAFSPQKNTNTSDVQNLQRRSLSKGTDARTRSSQCLISLLNRPVSMSERGRNPSGQAALQGELEALPVSEEEIKLAEIISSAPPRHPRSVLERLCGCFAPTHSRRPRRFKAASLLPPQREIHQGRATLILDLDETLIHSTFQPGLVGDFVVEVDVESRSYLVSVFKRPGLHEFLQRCADLYEVVIFTASMSTYADRVIDVIDTENSVSARLFRESCTYVDGVYVKNLELLGRDLKRTIIVDV